ncbi:VCBS repeat-containing protein [Frankia sp. AgPm24]|uniref:FG-GAP repeat domain-containing protein n=1 Tax=Frankia sp. AgPm24 TaxID=631128 RepID=UPI00200C4791|nr:VCBS repeat-containing protein [Frankia sp. AgPm24]MCK9923921.1 VCBS repeat-containing protein [Frankia sp. AgPm24]
MRSLLMITRRLAPTTVIAGILLSAGCSAGSSSPAAVGTVPPSPTTISTSAVPVTTPATTAPGGAATPHRSPGSGAGRGTPGAGGGTPPHGSPPANRPAIDGDVDGDGRPDTLSVTGARLLTRYSGGGSDSVGFQVGDPSSVRVLGAADADRDGHAEVFVQADRGAGFEVSTLFRYVDGHLLLVTLDGDQAALAYGGSTGSVQSWSCRPSTVPDAALAIANGPSTAPNVYTLTRTYYRFDGARLVRLRSMTVPPAPLDALPQDNDAVSGRPGCGSVRLGD